MKVPVWEICFLELIIYNIKKLVPSRLVEIPSPLPLVGCGVPLMALKNFLLVIFKQRLQQFPNYYIKTRIL